MWIVEFQHLHYSAILFPACPRFDSNEAVNRCQIVGQIEGGDELTSDIKKPYVQRMAPWSFPQYGSQLRRRQLARFVNSIWIIPGRRGACRRNRPYLFLNPRTRLVLPSVSQLPLVRLARDTWPDVVVHVLYPTFPFISTGWIPSRFALPFYLLRSVFFCPS